MVFYLIWRLGHGGWHEQFFTRAFWKRCLNQPDLKYRILFCTFWHCHQIFQCKTILLSSLPLSVKCYDIAYGFCCAIPNFYIFPTPYYCDVACVETLCVQFSARTASHAQTTWSSPTRRGLIMITLHKEPYLAIFSHCNSLIPIAYKSKDVKGPLEV